MTTVGTEFCAPTTTEQIEGNRPAKTGFRKSNKLNKDTPTQ